MRIAALALVGAVAVTAVLAGCSPDVRPTVTPTPKATAVFRSDAEALRAAETAYRAYESALDQALDELDASGLSAVAAGPALKAAIGSVADLKRSGQHDVGHSAITQVRAADLSGFLLTRPQAGQIYACLDVSGVQVVDAAGDLVSGGSQDKVFPMIVTLKSRPQGSVIVTDESVWNGSDFCE